MVRHGRQVLYKAQYWLYIYRLEHVIVIDKNSLYYHILSVKNFGEALQFYYVYYIYIHIYIYGPKVGIKSLSNTSNRKSNFINRRIDKSKLATITYDVMRRTHDLGQKKGGGRLIVAFCGIIK